MTRQRVDSLDPAFAGAFGAGEESAMPARVEPATSPTAGAAKRQRTWLRVGLRIVRDAAIAIGLMAMVPVAIVAVRGEHIWRYGMMGGNSQLRMSLMERVRPFALPADASITPMEAGLAFAAMQKPPENAGAFIMREPASRPEATWRTATIAPGSFANGFNNLYHGPSSESILEAVEKGFTADEARLLRLLATAPIWREFDLVARAPAADLIGGRFQSPFPADASIHAMPLADFKATKELAYAGVSRAAYHMSIGQRDSAETVLRSIISFGFVLADNGTTLLDALIGNVIVGIGRDALQRFYTITNDPRSAAPSLAGIKKDDPILNGPPTPRLNVDEMRAKLIAQAENPSLHRSQRFEALAGLSMSSCTNVRELLFGRRPETEDAMERARRDLARYPSEREVVILMSRFTVPDMNSGMLGSAEALAVSASTVAGTVLRNPAMAACSQLISLP